MFLPIGRVMLMKRKVAASEKLNEESAVTFSDCRELEEKLKFQKEEECAASMSISFLHMAVCITDALK
jgi:hypothetical protein